MKLLTFSTLILSLTLALQSVNAQAETQKEKLSLTSGTIDSQFEYLIQKSGKYQDYKVVKRTWLYTLKANTLDTLKVAQKNLTEIQNTISKQSKEIKTLKNDLSDTKIALTTIGEEKDSMALFGTQMSKASYNVLMWSIIGALFLLLIFFIYKFKNSDSITNKAQLKLKDVEQEYEEHRRIALEREQKVRRQLQDEINKNKA